MNYNAVIAVANADGKLLPGMTATVQFLTGSAKNVLLVPNAALRFRATTEMMAQVGFGKRQTGAPGAGATATSTSQRGGTADGAVASGAQTNGTRTNGATATGRTWSGGAAGTGTGARNAGMLWYLDQSSKLKVARVKTGLSDGQNTEITPRDSTAVSAGMQIIVGTTSTTPGTTATSGSANPLQPQSGQRRGPGGPGGF